LKKTYFALESKNLKDAEKYAKRITKTTLKAHGYEVLGEISQAEGDQLAAIEYFNSALKYDATFKLALLGISESYKKLGRLNDAAAFLNKASELYPEDEMILYYKKALMGTSFNQ
jgi:tetratricopeptide (TPR) repeat protein